MSTKARILASTIVLVAVAGSYGYFTYFAADDTQSDATIACEIHDVSQCPFCSPEVIELMGFCQEHGVPEAICTACRDDLEDAFRAENDWCQGHGLPESQCELCNPGVLDRWKDLTTPPEPSQAEVNGVIEIEMEPQTTARIHRQPALDCATEQSVVRLSSSALARSVGLEYSKVETSRLRKVLEAPAEIDYDARRHAGLAPRAPGIISEVRSDLGQRVKAGEVVAVVDSSTLGTAKSSLLQAAARVQLWEKNSARENLMLEQMLSTQRDALEAEANLVESRIALEAAAQRLRNLGLNEEQVTDVRERRETSSLLYLVAPFAGVVVGLEAVVGEVVDEKSILIRIADTSRMWAMLDVDAREVRKVAEGQTVLLTMDGQEDQTLGGRVTWINTSVDPQTRTIKVRAEFDNTDGSLRAHAFGSARIVTRDDSVAVLVPKAAVQWEGCCNIAFVRRSDTEFVPRKLMLGYDAGEYYEVLRGMTGGEEVVTEGSFLLKTELKKESIGAGCCEVDHLNQD